MSNKSTWKGYLFVGISVLATSNVYLFSKAALQEVSLFQFGSWWFFFGMLWNVLFNVIRGKINCIKKVDTKGRWLLVVIGLLEVIGTGLFFFSIGQMENPAIVSFIANTGPLFVGILGFVILRERFKKPEIAGMLLTLSGAFILSYKSGNGDGIFIHGAEYVVLSSLMFAISSILIKKNIKRFDTTVLSLNRSLFLFAASVIALSLQGLPLVIPGSAFINILIGSILGPFLTVYAGYSALKYIEASRASVLGSIKGLVVLLGSWIIFGTLPLAYQIIGGSISILGVMMIGLSKSKARFLDIRYKIFKRNDD